MFSIQWAISQVLSYQAWWWLVFIAIAAGLSYRFRIGGLILSQILIAILVDWLDIRYQAAHSAQMDLDGVFAIGVLGRILLINTLLLPLSIALVIRRRQVDHRRAPATSPTPSSTGANN